MRCWSARMSSRCLSSRSPTASGVAYVGARIQSRWNVRRTKRSRSGSRPPFSGICGGTGPGVVWQEAEGGPGLGFWPKPRALRTSRARREGPPEAMGWLRASPNDLPMAAGVPVLMLPPGILQAFGTSILAGLERLTRGWRAPCMEALPFLCRAQRVVLCAAGGGSGAEPPGCSGSCSSGMALPWKPQAIDQAGRGCGGGAARPGCGAGRGRWSWAPTVMPACASWCSAALPATCCGVATLPVLFGS